MKYQISGRVQGVGYRLWAKTAALAVGLNGYVKNMHNGDVELVACGAAEKLDHFEKRLLVGPGFAKVTGVISEFRVGETFDSFEILY
jgi:acylphosphatase